MSDVLLVIRKKNIPATFLFRIGSITSELTHVVDLFRDAKQMQVNFLA